MCAEVDAVQVSTAGIFEVNFANWGSMGALDLPDGVGIREEQFLDVLRVLARAQEELRLSSIGQCYLHATEDTVAFARGLPADARDCDRTLKAHAFNVFGLWPFKVIRGFKMVTHGWQLAQSLGKLLF